MKPKCPGFTEVVKYEQEGNRMIAQGWTQSGGQHSAYARFALPAGWLFDDRFPDVSGGYSSHGGCRGCAMTLVHLISIDTVAGELADVVGKDTPWLYIAAAIIAIFVLSKW